MKMTTFTLLILLSSNPFKIQIDDFTSMASCKSTLNKIKADFTLEERKTITIAKCYKVE